MTEQARILSLLSLIMERLIDWKELSQNNPNVSFADIYLDLILVLQASNNGFALENTTVILRSIETNKPKENTIC